MPFIITYWLIVAMLVETIIVCFVTDVISYYIILGVFVFTALSLITFIFIFFFNYLFIELAFLTIFSSLIVFLYKLHIIAIEGL